MCHALLLTLHLPIAIFTWCLRFGATQNSYRQCNSQTPSTYLRSESGSLVRWHEFPRARCLFGTQLLQKVRPPSLTRLLIKPGQITLSSRPLWLAGRMHVWPIHSLPPGLASHHLSKALTLHFLNRSMYADLFEQLDCAIFLHILATTLATFLQAYLSHWGPISIHRATLWCSFLPVGKLGNIIAHYQKVWLSVLWWMF